MEVEVNEGERSNCLICNVDINSNSRNDKSLKSTKICEELHVIFILQNILELPRDTLGRFLKKWGNPSEWEVILCENCDDAVCNAKRIYGEMLASMRKYKKVKRSLVKKVKGSVDRSKGKMKIARKIMVTAESRAFACTRHDYGTLRDPFVDGDLKAQDLLPMRVKTEPQEDERGDQSDASVGADFGGAPDTPENEDWEVPEDNLPKLTSAQKVTTIRSGASRPCPKSKKPSSGPPPPCPTSKKIKNRPDLEAEHARDTSRSDGIFCKCGRHYQTNQGFKDHLISIQEILSGVTHECQLCKDAGVTKTFIWKTELRRHVLDYHEGRRSICPLCGKAFIPKKLARHMRQVHDHRV